MRWKKVAAASASMAALAGLNFATAPAAQAQGAAAAPATRRMNVLFIAVDDLRPSFGAYGGPIKTPNIDKLAGAGTTFLRAYCQQAVCSPSRTSLLTGLRPDTTRVWDLNTHFRDTIGPDVVTLPQYFKNHGYHAQAFGKIYHGGYDDKLSWSVPHRDFGGGDSDPETAADVRRRNREARARGQDVSGNKRLRGPAYEATGRRDEETNDGRVATAAIEALRANRDKPFFLAVGFHRPHLPFVVPKRYWDLYRPEEIKLPDNYKKPPADAPPIALHNSAELRSYYRIPKGRQSVTDEQARSLIHGYYAAASFMDAQVGRVLGELDRLGLRENTVVVLWGDHGWFLGEYGMWCKHANYELATRSPLILSVPGQRAAGTKSESFAEFVDVYPTLCAAAGLPVPAGLHGMSLLPVTDDPKAATKTAAFSQYPRGGGVMGYAIRTDRWRYVEWGSAGTELYDHEKDPGENVNVAGKPENRAVVEELSKRLHAAMPEAAKRRQAEKLAAAATAAK